MIKRFDKAFPKDSQTPTTNSGSNSQQSKDIANAVEKMKSPTKLAANGGRPSSQANPAL
jgi:hypothetical protein